MHHIESAMGVERFTSRFSDKPAWRIDGKEFLHFHEDNIIDLRLTRKLIQKQRKSLAQDSRITLRPGASDWLEVSFAEADLSFVFDLVDQAIAANRRPR